MSTLTKVLIVLQTVFTIFLCGIVVTYVGNASNYKEESETQRRRASSAQNDLRSIEEQWDTFKTEQDQALGDAKAMVAQLKTQVTELEAQLKNADRDKADMFQQMQGVVAKMESAASSTDKQRAMYETAQKTLDGLRAQQIQLKQELKETNDVLIEKLAIISTQDEQIRRLTEQKTEISKRLERSMREYGLKPGAPRAATAVSSRVKAAGPVKTIDLKGRITDLDLESALAEISIGSEAGVQERMRFHVTRGSDYLCDLQIVAVDTDKAVGKLEVVKGTPRIGDPISTNF